MQYTYIYCIGIYTLISLFFYRIYDKTIHLVVFKAAPVTSIYYTVSYVESIDMCVYMYIIYVLIYIYVSSIDIFHL